MRWALLIEDEADHRLLIREAMARMSPPVDLFEVGTATEAITWVRERAAEPDGLAGGLVILDLGLPGPSGFRFLEWVREHRALDDLPVVVLTASENPMDAEHAFFLGAKGYYQKPADFRRYVDLFERAFRIHRPGGSSSAGAQSGS